MRRALFAGLLLVGCGGQPRPAELISLELRRQAPNADTLRQAYPALVAESDAAYAKATAAWRVRRIGDVTHFTRLSSIAWRTAAARESTRRMAGALAAENNARQLARAAVAAREARLEDLQQTLARNERTASRADARRELRRVRRALPTRQAATGAAVDAAADSIEAAEAMGAGEFAPETLEGADEAWRSAIGALRERAFGNAVALADTARMRASEAAAAARPKYAAIAPRRVEVATLHRIYEAARGLPGAEPRFEPRGLAIALRHLFSASANDLRPDRETTVMAIAVIATGNPDFKLMVEGHTAGGEASVVLRSRSATQAEVVAARLAKGGVPRDRMEVVGRSAKRRLGSDDTSAGRALNNRVEVVFLSAFPPVEAEPKAE